MILSLPSEILQSKMLNVSLYSSREQTQPDSQVAEGIFCHHLHS